METPPDFIGGFGDCLGDRLPPCDYSSCTRRWEACQSRFAVPRICRQEHSHPNIVLCRSRGLQEIERVPQTSAAIAYRKQKVAGGGGISSIFALRPTVHQSAKQRVIRNLAAPTPQPGTNDKHWSSPRNLDMGLRWPVGISQCSIELTAARERQL